MHVGVAAEDAGRAARRVEQHGIDRCGGTPAGRVARDDLRRQMRARRDCREVAQDDFRRRSIAVTSQPAAASCIVLPPGAAQASIAVPRPGAEQPRGDRRGDVLHPPRAVVIAGQIGDRGAARQAAVAGQSVRGPRDRHRRLQRQVERRRGRHRAPRRLDHFVAPLIAPSARRWRRAARADRASVTPRRLSVPNTPWTSLRGPPSTSGSTVAIAAWLGVPSASIWASAIRSAKRALASSRQRALRRRIDHRVEIGQMPQHFGGDRAGERAVVVGANAGERAAAGLFDRLAPPQHRVEQAQRRLARGDAGGKLAGSCLKTGHHRPMWRVAARTATPRRSRMPCPARRTSNRPLI